MTVRSDLAGIQVLVDTYNLRLPRGTGIKTYGLSLLAALQHLQAEVSLLTDRQQVQTKESALAEVLLFDVPKPGRRRRWRVVPQALRGLRGLLSRVQAQRVQIAQVIPDNRFGDQSTAHTMFNVPQCYRLADTAYRSLRRLTRIELPTKADIWHATCQIPLRVHGATHITTIHDVIPLRLPYYTLDDKRVFYHAIRDALRDSTRICAVSECTKRDLLAFYDVPEEKIVVTYQSLPPQLTLPGAAFAASILQQYRLTPQHYFLFVGNIEPKKNIQRLLQAFRMLQTDLPLVLVGRKAWLWEEQLSEAQTLFTAKTRYGPRLHFLEDVPAWALGVLYANAACFVFPSLYEGFGLPPLEAMRFGCPVITSDVSSLPEICQDAALYVDPYEPEHIAEAMAQLIEDQELRTRLIAAGYKRVQFFSLENYAARLLQVYTQALDAS